MTEEPYKTKAEAFVNKYPVPIEFQNDLIACQFIVVTGCMLEDYGYLQDSDMQLFWTWTRLHCIATRLTEEVALQPNLIVHAKNFMQENKAVTQLNSMATTIANISDRFYANPRAREARELKLLAIEKEEYKRNQDLLKAEERRIKQEAKDNQAAMRELEDQLKVKERELKKALLDSQRLRDLDMEAEAAINDVPESPI